ncbi:DoxX family protein [Jiulongibacter sediminis]|jgi:uncharacterized membrane protein YphA (DoxX/SURF4 family)|uniref:DoxX family protein n=1 Tax=Jiulongibacter sediminis TaxID=1605367 RepID=UPI0026E9EF5B|nr:DoxX family protein [Jiulongibacter sediminis]
MKQLLQYYLNAKRNLWFGYFTVFCRVALAAGFLPSGYVKIIGERFTSLSVNHPMGQYLEALHHTGYYYTFIGIAQVLAAILLLIPRTALLGALLYLPIILNITILSHSVRFDGSLFTAPLMTIAVFYLLCWDYERLKVLFLPVQNTPREKKTKSFPWGFFASVFAVFVIVIFGSANMYGIMPRNTQKGCLRQCRDNSGPCENFCECIHVKGKPFNSCLQSYENEW